MQYLDLHHSQNIEYMNQYKSKEVLYDLILHKKEVLFIYKNIKNTFRFNLCGRINI